MNNFSKFMLVAILLCATASDAADSEGPSFLKKGTRIINGHFSFSSAGNTYFENPEGDRTQEWILSSGGGYFIANQWSVSLHMEGRWFIQGDFWNSQYSIGPILHRYFDFVGGDDPAGHVVPYLSMGYLWGQARVDDTNFESKYNSGMVTMSAGISWMMTEAIATDLEFNYQIGQFEEKIPVDQITRDANRFSLLLGIKVFL